MDERASPHSRLAWLWVIEYLAKFKQIEISILRDLIKMVPEFSDDLGKNAREMVALRSLEELFSVSNGVTKENDVPESKLEFDLSASCEDVLQHILMETSISDIKVGGLKHLKWDLSSFLTHKRVCIPKCALEQLKDATVEGSEPFTASLKRTSGMVCINEPQKVSLDNSKHNASTIRSNGNGSGSQITAGGKNSVPQSRENGNELSSDSLRSKNLVPSKRGRSDLSSMEKLAGQCPGIQDSAIDDDILHINAKKNKLDTICTSQPKEQILISVHETKSLEHNPEASVRITEGEGGDLAEDYQAGGVDENKFTDAVENVHTSTDNIRHRSVVHDDQFQNNQMEITHNASESIHIACGNEPVCDMTSVEINEAGLRASDSTLLATEQNKEEISSGNDEFRDEIIDFETKKSNFLSSQCLLNDESSKISWTERNLCVKCNEGGNLLLCSIITCPFMVHETCLGSSANFDDNDSFHCPFCVYSVAVSKYLEVKKEVSLARKGLVAFVNVGFEHRLKEYGKKLLREEQFHFKKNGDDTLSFKLPENGHVEDRGDNQARQHSQDVKEISSSQLEKNTEKACKKMGKDCLSLEEFEGKQGQEPAVSERKDDSHSKNTKTIPLSQTDHEKETRKEVRQQRITLKKPIYHHNIDEEEASEEESVKQFCIRSRRQEKHCSYPAIPQQRRKKCPWTAEEEEILRKGVQLFSQSNEKQFPWTKILEFGASVFLSSRTPGDLKDKWRNMCKAKPKTK